MYIDHLLEVFKSVVSKYSKLNDDNILEILKEEIEAKKYDLQDQGLIEAILREDKKDLVEPLEDFLNDNNSELNNQDIKKEAIKIFIASLEHLINYYYNNVIGKHFSSS